MTAPREEQEKALQLILAAAKQHYADDRHWKPVHGEAYFESNLGRAENRRLLGNAIQQMEALSTPSPVSPQKEKAEDTRVDDSQYPSNPVATAASNESDPAFFRTLERWMRVDDPDGGEIIVLEFAEGGRINVLTDKPLLFIEPERY